MPAIVILRQELKFLAHSESPLKRTKYRLQPTELDLIYDARN